MRITVAAICVGVSVFVVAPAYAQTQPSQPAQAPQPQSSQTNLLTAEQLDQLVAPVALYPDNLLSEILMASTYPLEVVEADRWRTANKTLKDNALKTAVDKQGWDDSIKSLTAVPDVLRMMSTKLDWTQKLGDAVLAQQADVMDAVQRLRQRAQAQDKLQTTKQQKVSTSQQNGKDYIVIEPAVPNTLYVPYYDPAVVYGAWPYPAYPPYFFPAPAYIGGAVLATGLAFGAGVAIGAWAANGGWWGGSFHWGSNNININNNIDINNRNTWVHNSDHRHGVRYNNADVRNRFAKGDFNKGNFGNRDGRMDFRGHDGREVLHPDGRGPNAGDNRLGRDGAGQRRDVNNRPGSNRPGGGRRADRPGRDQRGGADRRRPAGHHGVRPDGRDGAFSHIDRGRMEHFNGMRGHASAGGRFGRGFHGGGRGGGGFHGGGFHGGGGFHRR